MSSKESLQIYLSENDEIVPDTTLLDLLKAIRLSGLDPDDPKVQAGIVISSFSIDDVEEDDCHFSSGLDVFFSSPLSNFIHF
jgi:hypothetical protein